MNTPTLTPGRVGHFELQSLLGEGGIGRVYAALDTDLGRRVALKALRPDVSHDPGFVERFRAEAASLARLNHPNITALHSMHREGRDLYMVMELVPGRTLYDVLASLGPLDSDCLRAIAAQACAGLSYAHRMGVIHRDIKPANLMLTDDGQLKIMDFGIARMSGQKRMTRVGSIVGTLDYMPPEQIRGSDNDARSDIYSLACVLYELACGTAPFEAETDFDLMYAQVSQPPRPLRDRCPDLAPELEAALLQALSKAPGDRPPSIFAFARALETTALSGHPVDVARDRIVSRLPAAQPPPLPPPGVLMQTEPFVPLDPANLPVPRKARSPEPVRRPVRLPRYLPVLALGSAAVVSMVVYFGLFRGAPPRPAASATVTQPAQLRQTAAATPPPGVPMAAALPSSVVASAAVPAVAGLAAPVPAAAGLGAADPLQLAATPPACPRLDGDMTGVVQGHFDGLGPHSWPLVNGAERPLFGVRPIAASHLLAFIDWVTDKTQAAGGEVFCCPTPDGRYRCKTAPHGQDLARALLRYHWAPIANGAPREYVQDLAVAEQSTAPPAAP